MDDLFEKLKKLIAEKLEIEEDQIKPDRVIEFGSDEFIELAEQLAGQNRQGSIALRGDVLLVVDDETILVRMPEGN